MKRYCDACRHYCDEAAMFHMWAVYGGNRGGAYCTRRRCNLSFIPLSA